MDPKDQPATFSDAILHARTTSCDSLEEQVQCTKAQNIVDLPTKIIEHIAKVLGPEESEHGKTGDEALDYLLSNSVIKWKSGQGSLFDLRLYSAKLAAKLQKVLGQQDFESIWMYRSELFLGRVRQLV